MNVIVQPWVRYTDFRGRSTRTEFWLFHILIWIVLFALALLPMVATGVRDEEDTFILWFLPCLFLALGAIIPGLAVGVRRLHDSDQPGWLYAVVVVTLLVIPLIGPVAMGVAGFLPGTKGENKYGADPRENGGMADRDVNRIFG